jgi:hypothetical protein
MEDDEFRESAADKSGKTTLWYQHGYHNANQCQTEGEIVTCYMKSLAVGKNWSGPAASMEVCRTFAGGCTLIAARDGYSGANLQLLGRET